MPESYQKLDVASERVAALKAGSQKNLSKNSGRPISKMSRTTAASINQSKKGTQSQLHNTFTNKLGISSKSIGRKTAGSVAGKLTKPNSVANESQQFKTAGDILNYPYSFDQGSKDEETIALDNKLAKQQYEEQYRIAEIQNQ